jgi:hypothetical protein
MRTGRPKQPLMVTEEERERLESLAHRARSQALLARRARVVLACAEGLDNKTVGKRLRCSLGMVGKWRSRFLEARLQGLYDEPRPGAPRKISDLIMERGLTADHTNIWRCVQRYASEPNKRCRRQLKPTNGSWRVDETYICQGGKWRYLYRGVDSTGATVDFWFSR